MGAWTDVIPETASIEVEGKPISLREIPYVKEAPDLETFVKRSYDAHREIGSRLQLKVDKSKPEEVANWRKENLPKLYNAGVLEAPPAAPADYGITKPEGLHDGLTWSDERAGKFATVLHKYGASKALAAELLEIHREGLLGAQAALKTSYDEGVAALKREHGAEYDAKVEQVKRLTSVIFKSPEEVVFFNETGMANHPVFLSVMMRLAAFAVQDNSLGLNSGGSSGGGSMNADEVRNEVADIMNNPKNVRHEGYKRNDKEVNDYIDSLYKKLHGDAKVII